jgi:hypothetical protein
MPTTAPVARRPADTLPASRRPAATVPAARRSPDTVPQWRPPVGPATAPSLLRRAALGSELTAISGGIAVLTWLVWLISSGAEDPVAQAVGARVTRRWTTLHRSIAYHRILHVPATLVFAAATAMYLWLM